MARGKIQIKKIENQTNRQVTYSKRRNGLFKKANELTVLCDAKVSIVMISSTGKLHEFISPSITTKQLFDLYQQTIGVDIWTTHYEKMQEQLRKLKDVNRNLRKEIRQRMGESLNDLNYEQLEELMENVDNSLKLIRERKYKVIGNQIETYKKKDARQEDPYGGLVEQEGDYNSVLGFPTGVPHILALRLQPNNNHHHHLHSGGGSDITTFALG
ncbi:hypothetical protein RDI58_012059 [Solanum bulbocastanum]|uniref:Uncharacterized protein n=1 Tax=Solanum bulbocastanum TaxID=147425 RepID=A0AAN8TQY8_SOLBU